MRAAATRPNTLPSHPEEEDDFDDEPGGGVTVIIVNFSCNNYPLSVSVLTRSKKGGEDF